MKTKTAAYFAIPIALFVLALAFGIWQWQTAKALDLDLAAVRGKAYFSALDGLSNMETDLGKVLIAQSPGQNALLLGRISSIAIGVSENLASLPSAYGADANGIKFLTQTADYTQTLATASAEGRMPSENDLEQLMQLQTKSGELFKHLKSGANFAYDKAVDAERATSIEYPSLLYDGPFSDGIHRGEAKGLDGKKITENEAIAIATSFVGNERVLSAKRSTDTSGPVPTFGVLLQLQDLQIIANVTEQGGKVLWMAPETAGFSQQLDVNECIVHAKAFLTTHGFGEMQESYVQQYDGMAVISFAAVQDDVLLYPDLINIQVRMDTGAVVGIEANNYWMNHVKREQLRPLLSKEQAAYYVSSRLSITNARLCVIPIDDGLGTGRNEVLCWEFDGTASGSQYLVYIDAKTGEEVKVLKVVIGGGGSITV